MRRVLRLKGSNICAPRGNMVRSFSVLLRTSRTVNQCLPALLPETITNNITYQNRPLQAQGGIGLQHPLAVCKRGMNGEDFQQGGSIPVNKGTPFSL